MPNQKLSGYPSIDKPWLKNFSNNADSIVFENMGMTVYQYLYSQNKGNLDELAIRYFDAHITYAELFENIEKMAKTLLGYGIKRGDYVTLCLPNVPETVYLKYALWRIGAVANLIDPRMNSQGIVDKFILSNSKLLITILDVYNAKIEPIEAKLPINDIVVISPADSLGKTAFFTKSTIVKLVYKKKKGTFAREHKENSKYIFFADFTEKYYDENLAVEDKYIPDTPIAVTYTSGTTGTPKGAQFTNEAYIAQHKNMRYGAEIFDRQSSFLGVIPMFSAYGSLCGMNLTLCAGWELILIPSFNPLKFDELIVKHKPNNLLGVPRFWETVLNSKKIDKADLSFLNIPVTGGDKISPSVLEDINNKLTERGSKFKLKVGYGSTELGGVLATTLDHSCYEPGSVGTILPGGLVKIVDPDSGKDLPYNIDGEIYAHSATQMLNYLNNESETENITYFDENGVKYYKTGDKGHLTENGILYIVDRYKRLMKRPDGHQVHASPIENVLNSHPLVKQSAAVGIVQKGTQTGVIPTAFVVIKETEQGNEELANILNDYCKERIADRDVPLAYVFVEKLPYNPMGKIDFKELEKETFETVSANIVEHTFFDKK